MKHYSAISLFSNCGAGDLGFKRAGFKFEVMAELDSHRLAVSLNNHPGAVGVPGDLRKTWRRVVSAYRERKGRARPSLLSACPPCQGMSSARSGKGYHSDPDAGSKDDRNLLVTVISKVASALQPEIIVVENVPAFFNRKVRHPKTRRPVSAANLLVELLSGKYEVFPFLTDLCEYGVPQNRKRAFLTFVRRNSRGLRAFKVGGRAPYPRPTHDGNFNRPGPIPLSEALRSFALPSLSAISVKKASVTGYNGLHCVPVWSERVYRMVSAIPRNTGRSAWDNDECDNCGRKITDENAVRCSRCKSLLLRPIVQDEDGSYRLIKGFRSSYRRMRPDRPAATVTTASGHVGSDNAIHPFENRLLSPIECALLQTIPANFKWGTALDDVGYTAVREMIGEAVPPHFTWLHGKVLRSLLANKWSIAPISDCDERCTRARKYLGTDVTQTRRVTKPIEVRA